MRPGPPRRPPPDLDPDRPDVAASVCFGEWGSWVRRQEAARGPLQCIWCSRSGTARRVHPGSALYLVAEGELQARCAVSAVRACSDGWVCLYRRPGRLERVTLDCAVRPVRGMRYRWWPMDLEVPFRHPESGLVPERP